MQLLAYRTRSILNALGVAVYVFAVVAVLRNASQWFGQNDTWLTGVGFLMLFTLSAGVVGSLGFGYPAILFLNGQKREALIAVLVTLGSLAALTALVLASLVISSW